MAHRRRRRLIWIALGAVGAAGVAVLVRTMRQRSDVATAPAPATTARPEPQDHAPPGSEQPDADELAEAVGHPVDDPAHAPGHRRLPPPPQDPLPSGGGATGNRHMPGHRAR